MTVQLIKKLSDEIMNCGFEVAAVEMSPQFHLQFMRELVIDLDPSRGTTDKLFLNIPIIFVHGDNEHYQLLNSEQYKLRIKYNDLLGIYNEKYNMTKVFISNGYKIENSHTTQFSQIKELENIVFRLNQLEKQIGNWSQKL